MVENRNYINQLFASAAARRHRFGVVLKGDEQWQQSWLQQAAEQVAPQHVFQLGGQSSDYVSKSVGSAKGHQLLGQECRLLICDFDDGFDANSFSAAIGCVVGGGLVVILPKKNQPTSFGERWLQRALEQLLTIEQDKPLPVVPDSQASLVEPFSQQKKAVELVRKVVEGHRKRPLVITADRGRGKSSALGIAAAELISQRNIHIVLTAPSIATVQPVFEHALRLLNGAEQTQGCIVFGESILEFVAPDEVLRRRPKCDCLLVDEASAIPIPMLKQMVEHYHRTVFSTTVHGYEGCGRGFTLKFQTWLSANRPGYHHYHLEQPIRWNNLDPLEEWHFSTFLLDAELDDVASSVVDGELELLDKQCLFEQPDLLRSCFALLVNAHYQTSPNDLMLLLNDDAVRVYARFEEQVCVGCMLTVEEGGLSDELIADIQYGKRRPKGHLVATTLANQLGLAEAAKMRSVRVMRIAVHPQRQRSGVGQTMLSQLIEKGQYDFYSTSFGATDELVSFWQGCGFQSVRLGSSREQASGTHSLIMIHGSSELVKQTRVYFRQYIQFSLPSLFQDIEIDLVRKLVAREDAFVELPNVPALIRHYCHGGASYDSIAPVLDSLWKHSPEFVSLFSDLVLRKIVQGYTWQQCVEEFALTGRKQAEQQFRHDLKTRLLASQPSNG